MSQESIEEIAERCSVCTEADSVLCFCDCHDAMHCAACIAKAHGLFTQAQLDEALRNERERAIKVLNDARHEGCTDLRELIARIRG